MEDGAGMILGPTYLSGRAKNETKFRGLGIVEVNDGTACRTCWGFLSFVTILPASEDEQHATRAKTMLGLLCV